MTPPPVIRWFWRLYPPLAAATLLWPLAVSLGPAIELRFWPVRVEQSMADVLRTPGRLCWTWVSTKLRSLVSDDMDVFLETPDDRLVMAIFERDTGMPWGRSRAVGLGPHRQSYCILMPPHVLPATPIVLRQTAWYPGWLGLWRVPVRLPDIVDPREDP